MTATIENVRKDLGQVHQGFNQQINNMVSKTKEQVSALDAALAEELTKSLQSLGRQLTALSEKFVTDYGPLTDKLQQVVRIAGRVN